MKHVLAFRFDVDSVRCIKEGIPPLMALGDKRGIRFSFFVNMGRSFNWSHNVRYFLAKRFGSRRRPGAPRPASLPTWKKLGISGILETMFLNPKLGERYRAMFDRLHSEGHELALHGGTDHVIWQRSLQTLTKSQIDELLRPAYQVFASRYGHPVGFASPGFAYNESVLELLDAYGFEYSSDLSGEEPFRARTGDRSHTHYQVPVNVVGKGNVPIIEQMLAVGSEPKAIVDACVEQIASREFALLYGHPYVEGVRAEMLGAVVGAVERSHDVVTVREYLARWLQARAG